MSEALSTSAMCKRLLQNLRKMDDFGVPAADTDALLRMMLLSSGHAILALQRAP